MIHPQPRRSLRQGRDHSSIGAGAEGKTSPAERAFEVSVPDSQITLTRPGGE